MESVTPSNHFILSALLSKESACKAGDAEDAGLIPWSRISPGEGNGHPLQYSCLENPMDRGTWRATVQEVAKNWTQLSNSRASLVVQRLKVSACNVGDLGSIPGLGRYPGEGNGNPLQYSCLENPMDGVAWWAIVHRLQTVGHN